MAVLLQHRAAALITWIQTAGTTGNCLARPAPGIGSTARPGNSGRANHALRLTLDHLIGAGHPQVELKYGLTKTIAYFDELLKDPNIQTSVTGVAVV